MTQNADSGRDIAGMFRRWFLRVEWKPQDCWIGVFWKRNVPWSLDVWVCVLPLIPLHFGWKAAAHHDEKPLSHRVKSPTQKPSDQHRCVVDTPDLGTISAEPKPAISKMVP